MTRPFIERPTTRRRVRLANDCSRMPPHGPQPFVVFTTPDVRLGSLGQGPLLFLPDDLQLRDFTVINN